MYLAMSWTQFEQIFFLLQRNVWIFRLYVFSLIIIPAQSIHCPTLILEDLNMDDEKLITLVLLFGGIRLLGWTHVWAAKCCNVSGDETKSGSGQCPYQSLVPVQCRN
jgi:hypothetical protein